MTPWRFLLTVIRGESALIAETIMRLADREQCTLILTTALRDVTPEATMDICDGLLSNSLFTRIREVAKTALWWFVQDLSE